MMRKRQNWCTNAASADSAVTISAIYLPQEAPSQEPVTMYVQYQQMGLRKRNNNENLEGSCQFYRPVVAKMRWIRIHWGSKKRHGLDKIQRHRG
ncbi:MAG: hypothetical protein H6660_11955 [Ardenticatenaceae bacterium]|nr:hypothetical protein [Ardenticatenaceae bacterium]